MLRALLLSLVWMVSFLGAATLEEKIASMLMVGFEGTTCEANSTTCHMLQIYPIAGVILFDKNIQTPKQLKKLTADLKGCAKAPLWIAIDEEGGRVSRLGKLPAFPKAPSAQSIAQKDEKQAKRAYANMAHTLSSVGINCNLAPSIDVAINPENQVIVKNRRSFSNDPDIVAQYGAFFIQAMQSKKILSTLKHFPGHGSSQNDSHLGFTDVSETWDEVELKPFSSLIASNSAPMIMSAHIYNSHIDEDFPATLSKKTITDLLRTKLGYDGVVISDDLQMGAIAKHYTLDETLNLAINAGIDILLFANQMDKPVTVRQLVAHIRSLIDSKKISEITVEQAYTRIETLKRKYHE